MKTFNVGDYAKVVKVPDPWEGSGEDDSDRESFLGHIGVVVEVDRDFDEYKGDKYDMVLLRFPDRLPALEQTIQRNIEEYALELVSTPPRPLVDVERRGESDE